MSRSAKRGSRSRSRSRHHLKRSHPIVADKSDIEDDFDGSDGDKFGSRSKRLKRIDVSNPVSALYVKTKTKLSHTIRGMDVKSCNFQTEERPGPDGWQKMGDFVNNIIGPPLEVNPEYDEEQDDGTVPKFIFSPRQNVQYDEFVSMQEAGIWVFGE